MSVETETSLYCDRETRPPVAGMRTVCGLQFGPNKLAGDDLRHVARQYGWTATGTRDFCPAHSVGTNTKSLYS